MIRRLQLILLLVLVGVPAGATAQHIGIKLPTYPADGSAGTVSGVYAADFEKDAAEYLSIADNPSLSTGDIDFAYATWIKMESSALATVIAAKLQSGAAGEWQLTHTAGNNIVFQIFNGSVNKGQEITPGTISDDTWGFIVAVHDASANLVKVSLDGGAFTTGPTSGAPADTAIGFTVGAYEAGNFTFDGLHGYGAFYKRALSAADVGALYARGPNLAYADLVAGRKLGLISWWDYEECPDGPRIDSHGSNDLADNNDVQCALVVYP